MPNILLKKGHLVKSPYRSHGGCFACEGKNWLISRLCVSAHFILGFTSLTSLTSLLQPQQPAPAVAPPRVRDGPQLRVLRSHPEPGMCPSCEHWSLTTLTVITPSANGAPTPHCRRLMTNLCFVSGQPPDTLVNALVGVIQSPDMAHILFFGIVRSHSD